MAASRVSYFLLSILIVIGVLTSSTKADSTQDNCEKILAEASQTISRIKALPPLFLDAPTVSKAIESLLSELRGLTPSFDALKNLENALMNGKKSSEEVLAQVDELLAQSAGEANTLMDNQSGDAARRQLEGFRVLLQRARYLRDRAEYIKEHPEEIQEEEESQGQESQSGSKSGDNDSQQSDKQGDKNSQEKNQKSESESKSDQSESKSDSESQSQSESESKSDAESAQAGSEKQDKGSDSKSESGDSEQDSQGQKESPENSESQSGQEESESGQKSQESNESSESQSGEEESESGESFQEEGESGESSSGSESGESSQGESDSDSSSSSESSESSEGESGSESSSESPSQSSSSSQSKSDSQSQSESDSKSDSEPESKSESGAESAQAESEKQQGSQSESGAKSESESKSKSKSKPDSSEDSDSLEGSEDSDADSSEGSEEIETSNQEQAEGGDQAGKGSSGIQKLMESLQRAMQNRMQSDPTHRLANEENRSSEEQNKNQKAPSPSKTQKPLEASSSTQKDPTPHSFEDLTKATEPPPYTPQQNLPNSWSPEQFSSVLKALLNSVWGQVMRQYLKQDELLADMLTFSLLCDTLAQKYSKIDFLPQYAKGARLLHDFIEATQVPPYEDLESLGLSLIGQAHRTPTIAKLKATFSTFNRLLTEISRVSTLSFYEQRLLEICREYLAKMEGIETTDHLKKLGETFRNQLIGPLSRRVLAEQYPPSDRTEELNWGKLVEDLKKGTLNELILLGRMRPFMKLLLRASKTPLNKTEFTGSIVPINEAEAELDLARDLDHLPRFYHDGAPMDQVIDRFLFEDMLETVHRDEVTTRNPKDFVPKKVTIVVYDVSGSMKNYQKYLARNAAILAYTDHCWKEVVSGQAEHVIYAMAFDGRPHQSERISGHKEFPQFFNRMRSMAPGSGGSTSITNAWKKAYELIAEHKKTNNELSEANILLITDGQDSIAVDQILEERNKIGTGVDIAVNAITIYDGNADIQKILDQYSGESETLGKLAYHHITPPMLKELINAQERLELLADVTVADEKSGNPAIKMRDLVRFQEDLVAISFRKGLDDPFLAVSAEQTLQHFANKGNTTESTLIGQSFDLFFMLVEGAVSERWTQDIKLSVVSTYFDALAKHLRVDVREVIYQMPINTHQRLLNWLKLREKKQT